MPDTGDVRDHLRKFFDIVDKLSDMEIKIDEDLLSIMLLYNLPAGYEYFLCAIESRDDLPSADLLRIKVIEENEARRHDSGASLLILVLLLRAITNAGIIYGVKRILRTRLTISLKLSVSDVTSGAITRPHSVKVKDNPLLDGNKRMLVF
ncbi:hypothetical protein AVEN_44034-1 [Araneus ventricosus]|uniref:Retrovirus-related Pol polyprotein from transposon TNT 1-94 n=1 Tax=Araneus ventricosus TaxID=182803 RepID=A0A4Y2H996_ARAVE|nr:hypothetical protein AVEN_44034-1 [Araneus ventricosus]